MKKYLLLLLGFTALAQNPQPFPNGARLSNITGYPNTDVSINSTTGGLLIPRMTTTQKEAIVSPTMFTQVIDVTLGKHQYYDGSVWVDSFGGGSQNLQQTLENGNEVDFGTDYKFRITEYNTGYRSIAGLFNSYISSNEHLIEQSFDGGYSNLAMGRDGFSDTYIKYINTSLGFFGTTSITFDPATAFEDRIFKIPYDNDIAAGRQWVIDQGYSTGGSTPTELTAVPSSTNVVINSSTQTGSGATIGLTDGTNAGLLSPAEKTKLANQSGTNSGDNTPNSTSQPLDSDLTAIAALTTDSFGRGVLTQTSAANVRTYIGAGTGNGTVTSVTGVSGETTVANNTTTPVVGIASAYTTARDAVANGKVTQTITNGVTATAPSEDAVFDALALKLNVPTGTPNATTFLRGDNVYVDITTRIQANGIGANNGTGVPLTPSTSMQKAFWDIERRLLFLQMLNVVQSVTTYALPITNNQVYVTHTGTTATYTFPTLANGTAIQYTIINMGSGTLTLNSNAGGSDIYDSGTSSASVTILAGQAAVIYGNGTKFVML
jgi:hypothetical protein